jgi:hypothetical protein
MKSLLLCLFLAGAVADLPIPAAAQTVQVKQWVARIKTKDGNIVGGVSVRAKNESQARYKVEQKYEGCKILSLEEK